MTQAVPNETIRDTAKVDAVNVTTHEGYFRECAENRDLLNTISIVVPVRPADGINCQLARMLSIWYGEGTPHSHLNDHMGGYIEHTRANIAYSFVHEEPWAKYLLMIDNDMEVPLNLPYLLARHDKPVVGGCAISMDEEFGPQLCFSVESQDGSFRFPCMKSGQAIPKQGLRRVGHMGTGAICIRRDVLESFTFEEGDAPFVIPDKIKAPGIKTGRLNIGEDIYFCNQARAKGFDMYADLEAHCGHRKTVSLQWDESLTDPSLKAESWILPNEGKIIQSR